MRDLIKDTPLVKESQKRQKMKEKPSTRRDLNPQPPVCSTPVLEPQPPAFLHLLYVVSRAWSCFYFFKNHLITPGLYAWLPLIHSFIPDLNPALTYIVKQVIPGHFSLEASGLHCTTVCAITLIIYTSQGHTRLSLACVHLYVGMATYTGLS